MNLPDMRKTVTHNYEGGMLDTSITLDPKNSNSARMTFSIDTGEKGNEFEVLLDGKVHQVNKLQFTLVGSIEAQDFLDACKDMA